MTNAADINKEAAPPPHPSYNIIHDLLPSNEEEKLTLCGFEGPEKLFEIWFKSPCCDSDSESGNDSEFPTPEVSRPNSPASVGSGGNRSDSESSDVSGIDSLIDIPTHPYRHAGHSDGKGQWIYRRTGLRVVPRPVWEEMLAIVKCQVLSVVNNEYVDAYLLSESSMFVYPNRLILKTCGTTTLLNAVSRILEIARDFCGMMDVSSVFYSRKAFLFPEKQLFPHGRWGDEVVYLDSIFPKAEFDTSAYVVGKINGDHWCLYTATPHKTILDCNGDEVVESGDDSECTVLDAEDLSSRGVNRDGEYLDDSDDEESDEQDDDVTLEIMMQDLDPEVTKLFWRTEEEKEEAAEKERLEAIHGKPDLSHVINFAKPQGLDGVHKNIRKAERRLLNQTKINDIYPNSIVDDFLFDPCGYSLNGLLGPYFYTIHVTPEDVCSYASFETSIPVKKFYPDHVEQHLQSRSRGKGGESEHDTFDDVVARVVERFRPGRFSVTLFTRRSVARRHFGRRGVGLMETARVPGFRRVDRISHSLGKWDLVFSHFNRVNVQPVASPAAGGLKSVVGRASSEDGGGLVVVKKNGDKAILVATSPDDGMVR